MFFHHGQTLSRSQTVVPHSSRAQTDMLYATYNAVRAQTHMLYAIFHAVRT